MVNLQFLLAAVSLVVVTLLLLLRPWQRATRAAGPDVALLNTALYREQLAELDRERAEGTLSEAEYAQARGELERRMLEDLEQGEGPVAKPASGHRTQWALMLALPLAGLALYSLLGTPEAMNPQAAAAPQAQQAGAHETGAAQIEQMVAKLAAKLEAQPDDPTGWSMLGRSYHAMGRMADAAKAFERVGPALQQDATLLADYADVLASLAGGRTAGKPAQLIAQALKLEPNNPMAISLAATDAAQRGDKPAAIRHWEHLLSLMPPQSEDARWIQGQLAELRGGAMPAAPAAPVEEAPKVAVDTSKAVSGSVVVAPALAARVQPDDTLFLFARAESGSRMPLAIQRLRAGQLPLNFQLDDSMSMSPAATLSGAQKVIVEARISRSGTATPSSGDLFGLSAAVAPGKSGLQIVIDQVSK